MARGSKSVRMRAEGVATRSCSIDRSGPCSHAPTGEGGRGGGVSASRGNRSATASRKSLLPWVRPSLWRAAVGTTVCASFASSSGLRSSTLVPAAAACITASKPSGSATSRSKAMAASAPSPSPDGPSAARACTPSSAHRSSSEKISTSARARPLPRVPSVEAARCSRPRCRCGAMLRSRSAAPAARVECSMVAARR